MSMLSTLGKVAVGIMVARTVGKAVGGGSGGGLGDMLGGMLGGKSGSTAGSGSAGGLGDMLGGLLGGKSGSTAGGGNLGDLMGSLMGANSTAGGKSSGGALADLLSSAMQGEAVKAEPSEEEKAKLILRAMIQAAKSDGVLDAEEQANILKHAGDASPEELAYVKEILDAPVDVDALVADVPEEMAQQVYLMSLLTINLDTQEEAAYLDRLAKGLDISPEMANAIHEKVGAQKLYS